MKKKDVASVIVMRDGKFLMLKRSDSVSSYNGYWNFPGGSVDMGETYGEAAARELKEEAGLLVHLNDMKYLHVSETKRLRIHYYAARTSYRDVKINDESSEYMWATIDEIEKLKCIPFPIGLLDDISEWADK